MVVSSGAAVAGVIPGHLVSRPQSQCGDVDEKQPITISLRTSQSGAVVSIEQHK